MSCFLPFQDRILWEFPSKSYFGYNPAFVHQIGLSSCNEILFIYIFTLFPGEHCGFEDVLCPR